MSNDAWFWLCVGFAGQALFTSRFIVQWIASEMKGESIFPVAFWYLSLVGGTMLLAYAISRSDPVIILGQALGVVVYSRNLMLTHRGRSARRAAEQVEISNTIVSEAGETVALPTRNYVNGELRKAG